MTAFEKILMPDEQVIFATKKHYIIFLVPVILTIFIVIFYVNSNPFISRIAFIPAIAALISWVNQFLTYYTSSFAVTTKRILMKEGFFFQHRNEARLSTISNVSADQSLLARILNYGTVVIYPFSGDTDPFTEIAFPNEFKNQLQLQLDKAVKQGPS